MSNASDFIIKNGVLTRYKGDGGDITIPDGITCVGASAFNKCTGITSVMIPGGVKRIGTFAFAGCSNLTRVTIPESATQIGKGAFMSCRKLIDAEIPNGVKNIEDYAFTQCGFEHVIIPSSVKKIGREAFGACSALVRITISEGNKNIDDTAFDDIFTEHLQIVAPSIPFDWFATPLLRRAAALGFLNNQSLYTKAAIADAYRKYVLSQGEKMLPIIFAEDMVDALTFYTKNKCNPANFDSKYLRPAQKANAVNCMAHLIEWASSNISGKNI